MYPRDIVEGRDFRLLIGGQLRPSSDGEVRETFDPSTGELLTRVPEATKEDVAASINAAVRVYPSWRGLGMRTRGDYLKELANQVTRHAEEFALLDALDAGNPIDAMRVDVRIAVQQMRDWPAMALMLTGDTIEASPGNLHYTCYEPYGVVGRIVPFNHPSLFVMTRTLAALVMGNTVVIKPGVQTPLSALTFGELVAEVLPPGVLNIVTGGAETGDAIVTHPVVKRIGFTGSVPTGMLVQRRAAESGVKHVSLELGGKNAMIIFPDVDIEEVVEAAVKGMSLEVCQGQSCGSTSRVFVHRDLYDTFVDTLRARLEQIVVGPAYDELTDMGPLISQEHRERVAGYIASGQQEGAKLVTGGTPPADMNERAYFLTPTMFADVGVNMKIAREEIFGPVISVLPWSDYESVIEQANSVEYGLTGAVWTSDINLAHTTANRLQAGYIWINDTSTHFWGTPFGGFKSSGTGREESIDELKSYVEQKAVHVLLKDGVTSS